MVASGRQLPLLAANPMDACTQLVRPDSFKNAIVLAQRGNCTFGTKVPSFWQPRDWEKVSMIARISVITGVFIA